jgi:uncharacterized protein YdcH (DUF465 family)
MNRLNDLENQNYRVNSEINDLKEINMDLKKKIDKYLILMQAKDIRYDNLDTKYNDLMIEISDIKTRRRTESIDEFTSMLQEGDTNDT